MEHREFYIGQRGIWSRGWWLLLLPDKVPGAHNQDSEGRHAAGGPPDTDKQWP